MANEENTDGRKRLLFIEDKADIVDTFVPMFEYANFCVDVTGNLQHGCELIDNNPYAGVILDGDFHFHPQAEKEGVVRDRAAVDFLGHLAMRGRNVPVVMISGAESYSWVKEHYSNSVYESKTHGPGKILTALEKLIAESGNVPQEARSAPTG